MNATGQQLVALQKNFEFVKQFQARFVVKRCKITGYGETVQDMRFAKRIRDQN